MAPRRKKIRRVTMTKLTIPAVAILIGGLFGHVGFGQTVPKPAILQVEIENWVEYVDDTPDTSKWATNPNVTPASVPKNFAMQTGIADIVAVNGQPVKGSMIRNLRNMNFSTAPAPGRAIGDAPRGAITTDYFEILKLDGTSIGTIIVSGLAPGPAPPGAPLAVTQGNFAIVGGTGAFLGVQGQSGQVANPQVVTLRQASVAEDPANRRQNGGGGRVRWVMHLIPMERPEILMTPNGPVIAHSTDFSLVGAGKPAVAGEVLSIFAKGLGPTKPGVDPGSPFPATPPAVVNSPVGVTVSGVAAEVLGAVGYPGSVDGYQVNFRIPADTPRGSATIQLTAAWIPSAEVQIAVQ
ncbi:MAG: hypothetical protein JST11_30230 [Acidobacteria bacterium]|nr:hypothetical protein [Acidobacteriota bacterium]